MKKTAQRAVTACRKVGFLFCASCDSTHKIEFAQQIHKNRGRIPRFLYKGRKNVSGGRGFSSAFDRKRGFDREAARKTIVFRQPPTVFSDGFYFFAVRDGRMYPSFFCHKMQKTAPKGGLLTDFDFICYNRDGQVHIAVRPSVPFPLSAAGRRWRECGKRHFSFSYVQ